MYISFIYPSIKWRYNIVHVNNTLTHSFILVSSLIDAKIPKEEFPPGNCLIVVVEGELCVDFIRFASSFLLEIFLSSERDTI